MDMAQQTLVEHTMLKHLMEGLRATVAWKLHGAGLSRKLSTLRFIAQSLQRHLEHLLALEEYDGYMDRVLATSPRLSKTVDALREQHDVFRRGVSRMVHGLEQVSSSDDTGFTGLCNDLLVLLDKLDAHNRKEIHLIQEAFERDGGGEG
jgi:hypothetical protein